MRSFRCRHVLVFMSFLMPCGGCSTDAGRSSRASADTPSAGPGVDMPGAPGVTSPGGVTPGPGTTPVATPPVPVDSSGLTPDGQCKPPASSLAVRRLTHAEYDNTVADLLGVAETLGRSFQVDPTQPFRNFSATLVVPPILAEQYSSAATKLAAQVVAQVQTLAPCAPAATGAEELACAEAFISSFGKRAYRRPIDTTELTKFSALFSAERARADYAASIGYLAEVMLQSPFFLYKTELGNSGLDRVLTPYEVASEISYLTTGSMPDATLILAADNNALGTPDAIEAEVRRLIATPRASTWLRGFVEEWLGIDQVRDTTQVPKDATLFPAFENLRTPIADEADAFIDAVLSTSNGSIYTLFSASWSEVNGPLGSYYGAPIPPAGATPQRTDLPPAERAGILTQAAFLAAHAKPGDSFPIARGKYLRTRVMCRSLPPPPANAMFQAPGPSTILTTRERFAQHSSSSACASCHTLIDPLGFGFENYDAAGGFRSMENGKPVDASGSIINVSPEVDGPYVGGVEFSQRLANSQVLRDCVTREVFRWANGREDIPTEACALSSISSRMTQASPDIREIVVGIARSEGFTLRSDR
ncbi:MAG: DUF1588 domain-containing protein [Polyangiaceae bacterium]|nr:DUF1588 domain-containing protein [Polyangiaceae bacterium]